MSNIAAGDLNKRIQFESPLITQAANGAATKVWVPKFKRWASINPVSVREFIQSAAEQSQVTHRIACRYDARIVSTWRITHNGVIYSIVGILGDKWVNTDYITIAVNSGVNQS